MKDAHFNEAIKILRENNGSETTVKIGTSERGNTLTIMDANATVTQRLVKAGFSLFITTEGTKIDNLNA